MPLMPKRVKFRKQQRGKVRGVANRGNQVSVGDYGLQCLGTGWLTARQIEAGRVAATHYLRREGKVHVRVFPDKPISKKPLETRMGKGQGRTGILGSARVKPGTVLFEIAGVPTAASEDRASCV